MSATRPVVASVLRQVDDRRGAATQLALHPVSSQARAIVLGTARLDPPLLTQTLDETFEIAHRHAREILACPRHVLAGRPGGAGPIARRGQRADEVGRRALRKGIRERQAPLEVDLLGVPPRRRGLLGEGVEGVRILAGQPRALPVDPALEFRGATQEEAVEKRATVERSRASEIAREAMPAEKSARSVEIAAASNRRGSAPDTRTAGSWRRSE